MLSKSLFVPCFVFLISLIDICVCTEMELTVEIDPARRECFHQTIKQGTTFEFEYQVIDGGDLDVNFIIQSPGGQVLITDIRKTDALHRLDAQEQGDYSFCLDNSFSRFSSKLVFFELITDEGEDEGEDDYELPPDTHLDMKLEDFKHSLGKIREHVDKGRQIQNILRAIELRDRSIQESNFERVNFWSGVQMFVLISVAVTHVLMIRSLFEDKSKVGLKMRT